MRTLHFLFLVLLIACVLTPLIVTQATAVRDLNTQNQINELNKEIRYSNLLIEQAQKIEWDNINRASKRMMGLIIQCAMSYPGINLLGLIEEIDNQVNGPISSTMETLYGHDPDYGTFFNTLNEYREAIRERDNQRNIIKIEQEKIQRYQDEISDLVTDDNEPINPEPTVIPDPNTIILPPPPGPVPPPVPSPSPSPTTSTPPPPSPPAPPVPGPSPVPIPDRTDSPKILMTGLVVGVLDGVTSGSPQNLEIGITPTGIVLLSDSSSFSSVFMKYLTEKLFPDMFYRLKDNGVIDRLLSECEDCDDLYDDDDEEECEGEDCEDEDGDEEECEGEDCEDEDGDEEECEGEDCDDPYADDEGDDDYDDGEDGSGGEEGSDGGSSSGGGGGSSWGDDGGGLSEEGRNSQFSGGGNDGGFDMTSPEPLGGQKAGDSTGGSGGGGGGVGPMPGP